MPSPTILNVSEGRIQNSTPKIIYYDRSTAQIEYSRDPDGTEFYLPRPAWAACTTGNVKKKNVAHFHPSHPSKTVRVRNITIHWHPPQSGTTARTFVYVEYDFLDSGTWKPMMSGCDQMIVEFAFAQLR